MIKITMVNIDDAVPFLKYQASYTCPHCRGMIWFFRNSDAPSYCQYCQYPFVRLFGLINGFAIAKMHYYKYGDEECSR